MASTEKDEDVQLGGISVMKPQSRQVLPEDAEESSEMMSLERSNLKHVPDNILKNSFLTYLCLEGNQISSIPSSMFICLAKLQWLDLRNNRVMLLPPEIGLHRSLEILLLEDNPISELPLELGNVVTLRGLSLRNCPIRFPPQHIVQQGYKSILGYLRSVLAEHSVSVTKTLPVVEKLQLSELMGSGTEEQDESGDRDELKRFRELKSRLSLLDTDELGSTAQGVQILKSHLPSVTKVKKATSKPSIIPELPLFYSQHWERSNDRRHAVMKQLQENEAFLEQRRKSLEALQKWRTQAKITQEKMAEDKQRRWETQRMTEECLEDNTANSQAQTSGLSTEDDDSSIRKLERHIRAHVERMQERRSNPRGTMTEQIAAAKEDVEEMRKLQARVLERRRRLQTLGRVFFLSDEEFCDIE